MSRKIRRTLYREYEENLQQVDPNQPLHAPPYWWEDSPHARLIVYPAEQPHAFLIVGDGPHCDADVASEICELYIAPAHRGWRTLRCLLQTAMPYLEAPWGFQVLAENTRARRLFDHLLKRWHVPYQSFAAEDQGLDVYKYRIDVPGTSLLDFGF